MVDLHLTVHALLSIIILTHYLLLLLHGLQTLADA